MRPPIVIITRGTYSARGYSRMFSFLIHELIRGQTYKTFYPLGEIYKLVLKLDNVLWLIKYLVKILGHYTQMYSKSNIVDWGTIRNLHQGVCLDRAP